MLTILIANSIRTDLWTKPPRPFFLPLLMATFTFLVTFFFLLLVAVAEFLAMFFLPLLVTVTESFVTFALLLVTADEFLIALKYCGRRRLKMITFPFTSIWEAVSFS